MRSRGQQSDTSLLPPCLCPLAALASIPRSAAPRRGPLLGSKMAATRSHLAEDGGWQSTQTGFSADPIRQSGSGRPRPAIWRGGLSFCSWGQTTNAPRLAWPLSNECFEQMSHSPRSAVRTIARNVVRKVRGPPGQPHNSSQQNGCLTGKGKLHPKPDGGKRQSQRNASRSFPSST